ncbi:MAG TPA: hypothetical protein VMU31_02795 [Rhizomicrobium sp.]|nr:hypothetical protein [Rhizomicrobium sp.]HUO01679.1 hypothetical protein [Rhizomicrobium sp.]
MTTDPRKIEKLLMLTARLTEALNADIAALERGRPREMRSHRPEVQQLLALYGREVQSLSLTAAKGLPRDAQERLREATGKFRETLAVHNRVLTRVKSCTEGMIRAIADDVAKKRAARQPYSPPVNTKPRTPGAIVYNNVV